MRGRRPEHSRFYGWRIAGLATVIAALTGPGQTIGVSVFVDHLAVDLDVSRSTIAACYLVGTLTGATTLAHWGRAIDRLGIRRTTTAIAIAFSLALAAMAGITGVLTLTAGFVFIRMLGQGALSLTSTVAVAVWFERRRGVVLGTMITASGALMALVPIGLDRGIETWGWRATWLVAAGVIAAVVVPIGWFGLVDRPSDIGQFVDGEQPVTVPAVGPGGPYPAVVDPGGQGGGIDRAAAIRTRPFWILALATACTSWLVTALTFHQIALLAEAGLSSGEAAAMFLPQVLGAGVAGVGAGVLVDRFGTRLVPSVAMGFMAATLGLAGLADGRGQVIVYAVVLGATTGLSRTATSTLVPAWFGTDHLGSITGTLGVIGVVGSAIGPVALSLTADALGSWRAASAAWFIAPVVIGVLAAQRRSHEIRLPVDRDRRLAGRPA